VTLKSILSLLKAKPSHPSNDGIFPVNQNGSIEEWPNSFFGELDESLGGAFISSGNSNRCCKKIGTLGIEPDTRAKDVKPWRFDEMDNAAPITLRHPKNHCKPKWKDFALTLRKGYFVRFWTDKKIKAGTFQQKFQGEKLF
jgi:hypothetical protein